MACIGDIMVTETSGKRRFRAGDGDDGDDDDRSGFCGGSNSVSLGPRPLHSAATSLLRTIFLFLLLLQPVQLLRLSGDLWRRHLPNLPGPAHRAHRPDCIQPAVQLQAAAAATQVTVNKLKDLLHHDAFGVVLNATLGREVGQDNAGGRRRQDKERLAS